MVDEGLVGEAIPRGVEQSVKLLGTKLPAWPLLPVKRPVGPGQFAFLYVPAGLLITA